MKRYLLNRSTADPHTTAVVVVKDGDAGSASNALRHHAYHSPDGFEWGYGGSGPSELARCILIDWFDLHDSPDAVHPILYQAFKERFIVPLDREVKQHVITERQIVDWLSEVRTKQNLGYKLGVLEMAIIEHTTLARAERHG